MLSPHVLRYWEQEFPQLKPVKRRGNRRYYQRGDVIIIRQIRDLLYEQGFTIGGARQRLEGQEGSDDNTAYRQPIRQSIVEPGRGLSRIDGSPRGCSPRPASFTLATFALGA